MKKILLLFIALFGMVFLSYASDGPKDSGQDMKKELQEYKIKYLAQEMDLKEDQKEKFVKVYSQFCDERRQIFRSIRSLEKSLNDNSTDEDYKNVTEKINNLKLKNSQVEKEYDGKFAEFLSAKQIYKLKEAEAAFWKKMHEMKRKKNHKEKGTDKKK